MQKEIKWNLLSDLQLFHDMRLTPRQALVNLGKNALRAHYVEREGEEFTIEKQLDYALQYYVKGDLVRAFKRDRAYIDSMGYTETNFWIAENYYDVVGASLKEVRVTELGHFLVEVIRWYNDCTEKQYTRLTNQIIRKAGF